MRITTNFSEFVQVTKMILDGRRVKALGLEIADILGSIWPHEMEEVLDFCTQNPEFHIVSFIGGGIILNRYDPRGKTFRLAEGDNDPNYIADRRHFYQWMFGSDPEKPGTSGDLISLIVSLKNRTEAP